MKQYVCRRYLPVSAGTIISIVSYHIISWYITGIIECEKYGSSQPRTGTGRHPCFHYRYRASISFDSFDPSAVEL